MKKLLVALIVVAVIAAGTYATRARLAKASISLIVQYAIGAPVRTGGFSLDARDQTFTLKDFVIYNPKGFPRGKLMEVNEIKVVYAWPIFIKKKAHLLQVTADVEEVVVIKRRDGKMNVDALKGLADPRNIPQIGDEEKFDEARRVHIDTLTLSVKRVVYKDYTAGEKPDIEVYDVRIENKNYKDIPGVQMLFLFMLKEAMAKTAIKGAAIYGVATFAGVGFWPAGVAIVVIGKDSAQGIFHSDLDAVFQASVDTLGKIGKVHSSSRDDGVIHGEIGANTVTIHLTKQDKGTKAVVSARKLVLPMPRVARSVLFQISENLPE